MPFYIGLSLLSNNEPKGKVKQGLLSAEGRRILSLLEDRPVDENKIVKDENGRPFIPGNSGDFSISHSGSMAAVSMVNGEIRRTGCDIQVARPKPGAREIAEMFFTEPENNYIFSCNGRQSEESRFFEIWVLKECFLKLRGFSVFDMALSPSFISNDGSGHGYFSFSGNASLPLSFYLYELAGNTDQRYFLAAVTEGGKQIQPELRWFSQSFLPCRSIAVIKATLNPDRTVSPNM